MDLLATGRGSQERAQRGDVQVACHHAFRDAVSTNDRSADDPVEARLACLDRQQGLAIQHLPETHRQTQRLEVGVTGGCTDHEPVGIQHFDGVKGCVGGSRQTAAVGFWSARRNDRLARQLRQVGGRFPNPLGDPAGGSGGCRFSPSVCHVSARLKLLDEHEGGEYDHRRQGDQQGACQDSREEGVQRRTPWPFCADSPDGRLLDADREHWSQGRRVGLVLRSDRPKRHGRPR